MSPLDVEREVRTDYDQPGPDVQRSLATLWKTLLGQLRADNAGAHHCAAAAVDCPEALHCELEAACGDNTSGEQRHPRAPDASRYEARPMRRSVSALSLVSSDVRCACSVRLGCESISSRLIVERLSLMVSYDDGVGRQAEHGRIASAKDRAHDRTSRTSAGSPGARPCRGGRRHDRRDRVARRAASSTSSFEAMTVTSRSASCPPSERRVCQQRLPICLPRSRLDAFSPCPTILAATDGRPSALPAGLVTFLLTDIEGSTGLFRRLGERWPPLLDLHLDVLRAAVARHGGVDFKSEGDALLVAFGSAASAFEAAVEAQAQLRAVAWPVDAVVRVRMGLHSGVAHPRDGDYIALALHQAARVVGAGHGGQVLASLDAVRAAGEVPGVRSVRLGAYRLRDFDGAVELFQVTAADVIELGVPVPSGGRCRRPQP